VRSINTFKDIFIYQAPVDMRKQINGLSILIEQEMQISPFSDALFVFLNQGGSIIRFIYWDKTGFATWSKRLEKARYSRPLLRKGTLHLPAALLEDLLRGLNIFQQGHKELYFEKIC
jgi:transposase